MFVREIIDTALGIVFSCSVNDCCGLIKDKGNRLILREAVRRYTEASDTGENISRSGSFPTSVTLGIEPRTSA